jgi:mono/diheme cytochrome c family protein
MKYFLRLLTTAMLLAGVLLASDVPMAAAQDVVFTPEFLADPSNVALGKQLWSTRCQLCHSKESYPGSAPPLQPWKYSPEFIYERITNGFRGMPALKQEFSVEQRQAIVAYVLSRTFVP